MTHLLCLAAGAGGATWFWVTHYRALRVDRDLHEQSHHMNGDAVWRLERHLHRMIANPRIAIRANRIASRKTIP